jgi:hypothetical protein
MNTRRIRKYVPPYDSREKHFPLMNFCGPGTNVARRLKAGVEAMDKLDAASLKHDLVTEPRGPYTSKGDPSKLRAADRELMAAAIKLRAEGYRPRWVADAVIAAMAYLLKTGARGRR